MASRGAAEFVNDVEADRRARHVPGTSNAHGERLMAAPLLVRNAVIGMMVVWRQGSSTPFTASDLSFLISVSQQAAAAIENARECGRAIVAHCPVAAPMRLFRPVGTLSTPGALIELQRRGRVGGVLRRRGADR